MNEIELLKIAEKDSMVTDNGNAKSLKMIKDLEEKGFLKHNNGFFYTDYWTITGVGKNYLNSRGYSNGG